jgi:hypothetical protein
VSFLWFLFKALGTAGQQIAIGHGSSDKDAPLKDLVPSQP